jgi:hypothetical protein
MGFFIGLIEAWHWNLHSPELRAMDGANAENAGAVFCHMAG